MARLSPVSLVSVCLSLLGELTTIITTATVLLQHQPPLFLFTSHLFSAIFFFPIIDLTPLSIIRHLVPRPKVRSPGYHHRSVAALRTLARNSTPQRLSSPLFSSLFLFLFLSLPAKLLPSRLFRSLSPSISAPQDALLLRGVPRFSLTALALVNQRHPCGHATRSLPL